MGIFSGYMICTDLDGTLAVDKYVSEANVQAIKFFKENGGMFVVATGRSAKYLKEFEDSFACDEYIIACNGNVLYNIKTQQVEDYYLLDLKSADAANEVIKKFESQLMAVSYVGIEERTTYEKNFNINAADAYKAYNNQIAKVVFTVDNEDNAVKIQKYIEEKYGEKYSIKRTWNTGIEIWNKNAGKEHMIRLLRKKLDNIHTIICAGDYENDILMLKEGDLSYAPMNAFEGAKEAADIIGVSCEDGLINQIVSELKEKLA